MILNSVGTLEDMPGLEREVSCCRKTVTFTAGAVLKPSACPSLAMQGLECHTAGMEL